jgi:hypothetical protein
MSENVPTTDEPVVPGTDGGTPPAATPPATPTPSATDDDVITLKKDDYNKLISQRDRNHQISTESEGYVATLAKREGIDDFLTERKTDFPDVVRDDLMHLDDPDALEAEAKRIQRRYEDVVQKKLKDVQVVDTPVLSPEDRAAELERLKKSPGSASFARMVELESKKP